MMVWTEPLPNERVPRTVARLWSCRAPATISEAEAEPPLTRTTSGLPLVRSPALALKRCVSSALRLAGGDDLAAIEERVRHHDGLVEQPAGVVAQVDDEARELVGADIRGQLVDAAAQALVGLLVELRDAQNADVAFDPGAHRTDLDHLAGELDLERLLGLLALDLERHRRIDRAAHLVDGLVEVEPLNLLAVDLGDDVVGEDARPRGRRIVDRRDDLDEAVLHRDLDAEAAEFAAGLDLHVAEALGVHVARMRIERGQHAVDGRFDQLGFLRASRHNPCGSSRTRRRKG